MVIEPAARLFSFALNVFALRTLLRVAGVPADRNTWRRAAAIAAAEALLHAAAPRRWVGFASPPVYVALLVRTYGLSVGRASAVAVAHSMVMLVFSFSPCWSAGEE